MLTRLDDGLIDHDKVEEAGLKLGKQGYFVALGAVAWAICYSNKKLTDGHVPSRALDKYGITESIAKALVTAGLWDAAEDGYIVHDFHDWNPTASSVKDKRRRDRERKRVHAGFRDESPGIPRGIPGGSTNGVPPSVDVDSSASRSHAHAGAPADLAGTGRVFTSQRRRHPLEEMPDASLEGDHCERAEDFLVSFARLHLELRGARFTGKYERDQPEALRLVTAYVDAELEAITRLYLVATGGRYDNEPRSPGRLRDAAGEMEKRLKEAGKWPTAA